jgi:hypothetical protein
MLHAAAARASAMSPSGQNRPLRPVGVIAIGSSKRCPNISTDMSMLETSFSIAGRRCTASIAARLRLRQLSSSAPPSR